MKNTLHIENFLIFKNIDIDINQYTVFIGPQASGKSIIAKLIYLFFSFKKVLKESIAKEANQRFFTQKMIENFTEIFPAHNWNEKNFLISFSTDIGVLEFRHEEKKKLEFSVSKEYEKIISAALTPEKKIQGQIDKILPQALSNIPINRKMLWRLLNPLPQLDLGFLGNPDDILFIPAGRSFFSQLEINSFYFLQNKAIHIDFFLIEFGIIYQAIKGVFEDVNFENEDMEFGADDCNFQTICQAMLHGIYQRKKNKDYIVSQSSGREFFTEVCNSSSGQQELLPIILTLIAYKRFKFTESTSFIIEEPEAHIYPQSQYELVKYMVASRKEDNVPLLVTTHSPYILTAFNNLAYAGQLEEKLQQTGNWENLKKLDDIYNRGERISQGMLSAYMMKDGEAKNIIDPETGLILAEELDSVSEDIGAKFSELLNLDCGE